MRRDDVEGTGEGCSRRGVLRAMAAVGATGVAGLAGCGGATSRRYEADPVALGEDAGHLGYLLQDAGTWERTESAETIGLEMDATLVNQYAAYRNRERNLGFVATPAVEEGGQTLNPLADRPLLDVVDSEEAGSLLQQVDVGQDGDVDWRRGPERLDGDEVQFLEGSAEAAAVAGVTGDGEAVLLNVARTRHEGDVVFGVQADIRTDDERRPSQPLSGSGWNLDDLWTGFDDCLGRCDRVDPCAGIGLRSVEITQPDHRGMALGLERRFADIVDSDHNKTGEERVEWDDGPPYVEMTLKAETSKIYHPICTSPVNDYDDYRWSYRGAGQSNSSYCTPDSWTTIGTGDTQTVELSDCRCVMTNYEIRVQGIDSNGNVASTDTIEFAVNFGGC